MIIRKPQITDTLLYPEFFDKLLRQKNIQNFKYKLSDHNYSGSNYCSFEGFYNQDMIFEQYETLFDMPVIEWVKKIEAPSEIAIRADSTNLNINYYETNTTSAKESDFYITLKNSYKNNERDINSFDFSEDYYRKINSEERSFTKLKFSESGVNKKTKYKISVENSNEYIIMLSGDNKEIKFEEIYSGGYKRYKIINSNGTELGELILK